MATLLATLALMGCAGDGDDPAPGEVSRAGVGDAWPLVVESGTLSCEGEDQVYFTTEDGKQYALNGTARSAGDALDATEIQDVDSEAEAELADQAEAAGVERDAMGPVVMQDLSPLVEAGLKLC